MSAYLNITKNLSVFDQSLLLLDRANYFNDKASKLFLACSGGIDSMVLLALAAAFSKGKGIPLTVLHVNYGLRGEESDADEVFVRETCESLGVAFKVLKPAANPKGHVGVQAWARQIRYDWFRREASAEDKVLLAHHKNDLIETILMRIVRGSSLSGLMGMKASEGIFLRPLLEVTRSEIENYAKHEGIHFREDSSNLKLDYSRNRLRHQILPELESMFPGASENLMELAKCGLEWTKFFASAMATREEPESAEEWQEFGFYPASQLFLMRLHDFLNEEFSAKKPSRPWLEALYEALCAGTNTVLQLDPSLVVKIFNGRYIFEHQSTEFKQSSRWIQFQGELTKSGLASRLSPGARIDVELDATMEMQDNENAQASPK